MWHRHAFGPQRLGQHLGAEVLRLFLLHRFQVMPDLRACTTGAHEIQPARIRPRAGRDDDVDDIPAAQFGAQCDRLTVDLGGHAVITDIGVNRVGEIDWRGTAWQGQDLRLRREHIHRVGEQINLDVFEKLAGVAGFVLDVDQRLQPHRAQALCFLCVLWAVALGLVHPVRGNAFFGHGVHWLGADLELDRSAQRADQRGVQ